MPILKNSRHEKFAQLVANGKSATEAYKLAGYEESGAHVHGPQLATNSRVAPRIAELKARSAEKAAISRDEVVEILGEYARGYGCPAQYPHEVRLKAIAQLTKMCGWDSAEKHEHSANESLIEALKRLRGS